MIQLIGYFLFTALILFIAKTYLDKKGHPKALFYLFFAEMWERFSFYGMRALLTLYLIKDFYKDIQNNEEIAYGIYAAYGALVYLTPLLGGYLADKYIGYRKSILFGGILMALGHFFMAFPTSAFMWWTALDSCFLDLVLSSLDDYLAVGASRITGLMVFGIALASKFSFATYFMTASWWAFLVY